MQNNQDPLTKYYELKEQIKQITKEKNRALSLKIMNERYINDPEYKEKRKQKSYEYYHNKQKLKNAEKKANKDNID
jgi:hypothetical protein